MRNPITPHRVRVHMMIGGAALLIGVLSSARAKAQYYAPAQNPSEITVVDANTVFTNSMQIPEAQIPPSVLANAQGIAIFPGLLRGAFVFGVQHGRGIMLIRDANRQWQAPRFVQMTGGSFGYQIGVQATDLILVFRTPQSVNGVLNGTMKVGVDASAAAGPVGRQAAAGTDLSLSAEILSYSRARGAFVGVSIDGSAIALDPGAEAYYYQPPGTLPASALTLIQTVSAYSGAAPVAAVAPMQVAAAGAAGGWVAGGTHANDTEATRQQLAASSNQLMANLDNNWKTYMALPPQVYMANQVPSPQDTQQALQKYEDVARNPQYAALTSRPEFQQTVAGLRKLNDTRTASNAPLQLGSPPAR